MALKIKRKFIEDAAIDGLKLRLATGQAVKLLKSDGSTEVRLIELDESTNKIKLGGAVAALKSDVDAEAVLREAGDAAISGQIQTLIGSEAEARVDGDVALSNRLDVLEGPAGSIAAAVEAEATARSNADIALDSRLDVIEGPESQAGSITKALKDAKDYADGEVSAEATARSNADDDLSGRLDIIEGPDSQAGSVAKALKDAKDYVNDVVGVSSTAVAAFTSLAAQMVDENAATGIINALGSLDERLDTLQGVESVTGSVAKALKDAKDYTDAEVGALETALDSRLDIIEGPESQAGSVTKALKDAKDYADGEVSAEATARSNADDDLQSEINATQTGAGLAADGSYSAPVGSNYLGSAVSLKGADSALDSAIKDIQDQIDGISGGGSGSLGSLSGELDATQTGAGLAADGSYSAPVGSNHLGSAVSLKDADSKLDSAIKAEKDRAEAAEFALDARLDIIEGSESQAGSVAKALKDAKDYVNDVVGVSSVVVSAFTSLAAQMVDGDAATGLMNALGTLDGRLDVIQGPDSEAGSIAKALKDAKDYTDAEVGALETALDSRLDVIEANVHKKQKFVIGASEISNGYVDLDFIAMESSIVAGIGRLMIHEGSGEDFTVSTVAGKSRITFVGNLVSSSAEQLTEGDILYVKYVKA